MGQTNANRSYGAERVEARRHVRDHRTENREMRAVKRGRGKDR